MCLRACSVWPAISAFLNAVLCLIILHDPAGSEIAVDTRQILMLRPVEPQIERHVARGTQTIVYISGIKVGVTELPHEVERLTKICEDGPR